MRKFFPTFLDEYDPEFLPEEKQQKWFLTKQVIPVINIKEEVRDWEPWSAINSQAVSNTSSAGYYAFVNLEDGYEYEIYAIISYTGGDAQIDRVVVNIDRTGAGGVTDIFRIAYSANTTLIWAKFDGGLTLYPKYNKSTNTIPTSISTYMSVAPAGNDSIITKVLGRRRVWEW